MPDPADVILSGECPRCGYDLRGLVADTCPECGLGALRHHLAPPHVPPLPRLAAHAQAVLTVACFLSAAGAAYAVFGSARTPAIVSALAAAAACVAVTGLWVRLRERMRQLAHRHLLAVAGAAWLLLAGAVFGGPWL